MEEKTSPPWWGGRHTRRLEMLKREGFCETGVEGCVYNELPNCPRTCPYARRTDKGYVEVKTES